MPTNLPAVSAISNNSELARQNFLTRYGGGTRKLYELDLQMWFDRCEEWELDPLAAKRAHLEAFGAWLQTERGNSPRSAARRLQTLRSFYKLAGADELIDRDPTFMMRMPSWSIDRTTIRAVTVDEMLRSLRAAKEMSASHEALIAMMCYLGMRVSEVCSVQIEDFGRDVEGYKTLTYIRKGGASTTVPIPIPLKKILKKAKAGRRSGPLILTRAGRAQNRRGAYDWVKRIAAAAELREGVHPHSYRHGAAKMLLAAGVPIEEVQHFMGHADIRTTMHYAQQDYGLGQHGTHAASRILARAS